MARTGYGIVGLLVPHSQDSTLLMMKREGPHSKLIYSGWTYIHLSVGGWMDGGGRALRMCLKGPPTCQDE